MSKSYKNQSISDISLSLARRQVALRHGFEESTVKQADVGEYLSGGLKNLQEGAKTWWNNRDPVAQKAMIGAGLGGVAGASSSLLRKNRRKHFLRDAFTGALGGGALFGGIGAVQDYKRLTDNVIGGNREKDQQLMEAAQEAQEDSSAGTGGLGPLLTAISDKASDLSRWVNPHQKVEEATGGLVSSGVSKTVADVAALGTAASAADQLAGKLNTSLGGHVNTTEAQFLQLRRTAMEQAKQLGVPLYDTPIGIKLNQITNGTDAVKNLGEGNFNYFKDGVRKGVRPVAGFAGKPPASNKVIPFRDVVKAMGGESATIPSGSALTSDKTMRVEVDQPLSRQGLQRVGEKPRFSNPRGKPQGWLNWLTRTSGTKGSRTARIPKSSKGKLALGLGVLAWYLARKNQGATAAGKAKAKETYSKYNESSE